MKSSAGLTMVVGTCGVACTRMMACLIIDGIVSLECLKMGILPTVYESNMILQYMCNCISVWHMKYERRCTHVDIEM